MSARVIHGNLLKIIIIFSDKNRKDSGTMTEDLAKTPVSKEVLQQSYEFTKTILDSVNDAISIVDVNNFKIVETNSVFLKELGLKHKEEVIGKTCYEIIHKQSRPCTAPQACPLTNTLTTCNHAVKEHVHHTNDGKKIYVEVSTSPIRDKNGKIKQVVHVSRDITERKKAEEALLESQELLISEHEKLRRVFQQVEIAKKEWEKTMDCVGDIIILTDNESRVKRCNKAFIEFMKKPFEKILGEKWEILLQERGLKTDTFYGESIELISESTQKWYRLKFYPYGDSISGFSGNVITLNDTTEIKKVSEELERTNRNIDENRKNLQLALDEISSLIQQVVASGTSVRFTNPDIQKCYEVKNCSKEDCPCFGKEAMRCWQVAGTYCGGKVQGAFAQKYGNCSKCNVYQDAISDPIYLIGEHFNNMMHILDAKNKELERAYTEIKSSQSKILQQEKMASIGQLAAGVAHEINNPMGFISSNLGTLRKYASKLTEFIKSQGDVIEALKSTELAEKMKEKRKGLKLDYVIEDIEQLIKESLDGAERVKKIVQNLKSFSRVDEAEYKHADINECIESTLNIVWNELKYKAAVTKEYGELPLTKCYPQQLNQVFMNVLVNAAHAIETQGEIKIKTWNGDGAINISISDTGCGIPEDKISRIFEPFYTTKPVGKGTGLGLSIAYEIVKKHKGEIAVTSDVGKGTTFNVVIPVVEGK